MPEPGTAQPGETYQRSKRVLCTRLKSVVDKTRHDAAVFAVLTVLLTPAVVAVAVVVLIWAISLVDLPLIDNAGYAISIATGVNLALGFMAASFFLRPHKASKRKNSDFVWLAIASGFFCALLVLSYGTGLPKTDAQSFWIAYAALALAMLACIGHAYQLHDDYYLGWSSPGRYMRDNPFTIRDDIDRAHFSLGFAVSLAHLILVSYSEVFGSTWLWRGLKAMELSASVDLLEALAAGDASRATSRIQAVGQASSLNIVRALVKLEMITLDAGGPRLSMKGREFLDEKAWEEMVRGQ